LFAEAPTLCWRATARTTARFITCTKNSSSRFPTRRPSPCAIASSSFMKSFYSLGLPYTLFEVRFTPAGHDRTLIGAGRERRSTWIDIVCNDSDGFEAYYAVAIQLIKELGGRPHLGKYCKGFDMEYLQNLHGEYFETFQRLMVQHDPAGKFSNAFTERLSGRMPTCPVRPPR
jgi:hypothetical protein